MKLLKILFIIIFCVFTTSCDKTSQNIDHIETYYSVDFYNVKNKDELPFNTDLDVGKRYTQFIHTLDDLNYVIIKKKEGKTLWKLKFIH